MDIYLQSLMPIDSVHSFLEGYLSMMPNLLQYELGNISRLQYKNSDINDTLLVGHDSVRILQIILMHNGFI